MICITGFTLQRAGSPARLHGVVLHLAVFYKTFDFLCYIT